jgi:signal transduction histidine kinase
MAAAISRFFSHWWSVIAAVTIALAVVAEMVWSNRDGLGAALLLAGCVGIAFCRWYSYAAFASLVVLVLSIVIAPESTYIGEAGGLWMVFLAGMFGSMCERRERIGGLVLLLAGVAVLILRVPEEAIRKEGAGGVGQNIASNFILAIIVWSVAWLISSRVRTTRALRARAAHLEAERDALAAQAVAEERARIARELHDVVAHSVSVMTVQAGGVRRLLTEGQTRERDALAAIEETGRRALTEMRRMVSVMRSDHDAAALEPQPGIATLPRLVDEVREAGLPVTLNMTGQDRGIPTGLDLSVYRIVQEGLTNVMKHAGPAHAWVNVTVGSEAVELLVEDDGSGAHRANGGGHGLIGMRERVAVYGGELQAGARPGGGFRVQARLPIDGAGAI